MADQNLRTKEHAVHNVEFAQGGDTPMFGKGDRTTTDHPAGPQKSADTAVDAQGGGGKYAEGGKTKMFGFTPSQPAKAGITSAR